MYLDFLQMQAFDYLDTSLEFKQNIKTDIWKN